MKTERRSFLKKMMASAVLVPLVGMAGMNMGISREQAMMDLQNIVDVDMSTATIEDYNKIVSGILKFARSKDADSDKSPAWAIADMMSEVESNDLIVTHMFVDKYAYGEMRKFDRDVMSLNTKKGKLKLGNFASVWGAEVFVNKNVPVNSVIVFSHADSKMKIWDGVVSMRKLKSRG